MKKILGTLVAGTVLAAAAAVALPYGFGGSLDSLTYYIQDEVDEGDPVAAKIQILLEKPSSTLSRDWQTASKAFALADRKEPGLFTYSQKDYILGDLQWAMQDASDRFDLRLLEMLTASPYRGARKAAGTLRKIQLYSTKAFYAYYDGDFARACKWYGLQQRTYEKFLRKHGEPSL